MPSFAILVALAVLSPQTGGLKRFVYPLARPIKCPKVELITDGFPSGREWGLEAKGHVEEWFGKLSQLLATDGVDPLTGKRDGRPFHPPKVLKLVIKPKIGARP